MRCAAVHVEDEVVRLLFGETHEAADGILEADRTIVVSSVWRVEQDDDIVAASGDLDDPERSVGLNRLIGNRLDRAEVSHPGYDLTLYLDNGLIVRCFPCDSLEFAEDVESEDEVAVSWWVDGVGIPDDWEAVNEAFFEQHE